MALMPTVTTIRAFFFSTRLGKLPRSSKEVLKKGNRLTACLSRCGLASYTGQGRAIAAKEDFGRRIEVLDFGVPASWCGAAGTMRITCSGHCKS